MDKLGKMIRITDLRSVWPHEANDFTKWLAQEENLTLLGDAIDIKLQIFKKYKTRTICKLEKDPIY